MAKGMLPKKKAAAKIAVKQPVAKKAAKPVQVPLKKSAPKAAQQPQKLKPWAFDGRTTKPAVNVKPKVATAAPVKPKLKKAVPAKPVQKRLPTIKQAAEASVRVAPKPQVKAAKPKKIFTKFFVKIFSRHPSIAPLRKSIMTNMNVMYRHGSTTEPVLKKYDVEINSPEAIRNSASKLRMKRKFQEGEVKTAVWYTYNGNNFLLNNTPVEGQMEFPIVAKHIFGSRGRGNTLLKTAEEFENWKRNKVFANYIFEKFYNYNREYRLHVTEEGCFYTCRKMLKADTPEENRWFRNDSNSVWIVEENEDFDKPKNWAEIERECVKAIKATGLDVGACDVKVQSAKTSKGKERETCDFIVIEVNSAPSMGEITLEKYKEILPRIAERKFANKK